MFNRDFERLAGALQALKGRFILSINDTPEIRAIFDGFEMQEETLSYSINLMADTRGSEGQTT